MSGTRTYVILAVPNTVYDEIRRLLVTADYGHAFHDNDGSEVIDMHGIALQGSRKTEAHAR